VSLQNRKGGIREEMRGKNGVRHTENNEQNGNCKSFPVSNKLLPLPAKKPH
jgi:hypothetical protein